MCDSLISVIVPVYNVEKYLDRCIKSIVCQTYSDFELILVDDGSSDNCPKMCDKWAEKDKRVKVIHQVNQGPSTARNAGIREAQGRYIAFVDSDDWIEKTMLKDLINIIKKYSADIAICNFATVSDEFSEKSKCTVPQREICYNSDEFMRIVLKIGTNRTVFYPWAKLYTRETLDMVEHFPAVINCGEDIEGMFKAVLRSHKIVETTKIGYYYCDNSDGITRTKFSENFLSLHQVWIRVSELCKHYAPQYQEYVDYNLIRSDFTILTDMILLGDKETDHKYRANRKEIQSRLKTNIQELMKGPMVRERKILAWIVCYFYTLIRIIYRALPIQRR